jgi:hypothetical protein
VLLLVVIAGMAPAGSPRTQAGPGQTSQPAPVRQTAPALDPTHVAVPTPGAPIR